MFVVKATYRGETRKLTFPACFTFPIFDQLCEQLCRVFPLTSGFIISRLLFSPNSANSIRLLIGHRVHAAEDYVRYIEPYQNRLWPDAMLRLTVLDGDPLENSAAGKFAYHWSQSSHGACTDLSGVTIKVPLPEYSVPMSCVPPPPILYSTTPTPIPNPMPLHPQTPSFTLNVTNPPCCSVDASKTEIQALIDHFMRDLNGLLSKTFPVQNTEGSRDSPQQDDDPPPPQPSSPSGVGIPSLHNRTPTSSANRQRARSSTGRNRGSSQSLPSCSSSGRRMREAMHNAVCDLCDSGIRGTRYKCLVCPDFDTCETCFTITNEQHPNHSFVKISDPADYIRRLGTRSGQHHAVCNVCNNVIFGPRYKCLHPDCPDYDLCDSCESHPMPQHPENHPMAKLKVADISLDVIHSQVTTQRQGSAAETSSPIARPSGAPVTTPVESLVVNTTQSSEVMTPHQSAVETEIDTNDWLPASLPDSPAGIIRTRKSSQGSETATSIESVASEISEIRMTPSDSPLTNEAMLLSPSGVDAVPETSVFASPPASQLGKTLERERQTQVPFSAKGGDAAPESFAFASPPASLLGKTLEREGQTQMPLSAKCLSSTADPHGQTFPPGAQFIKCWHIQNDGTQEWPNTTQLVYTGGDRMSQDLMPILIGSVKPGGEVKVPSPLLKAPELPGTYTGFWSLRAGVRHFGNGLWVKINVVEQSETSQEGLSSSSIMKMPEPVLQVKHEEFDDQVPSPITTEHLTDETISDKGNISLDSCDWEDCSGEAAEEYVILYDDSSSDGN